MKGLVSVIVLEMRQRGDGGRSEFRFQLRLERTSIDRAFIIYFGYALRVAHSEISCSYKILGLLLLKISPILYYYVSWAINSYPLSNR